MSKRFDTIMRAVTHAADALRLDANETAIFARQLEDIDSQLYKVLYPELKGIQLVPVKSNINPGAEEYTYRAMDYTGEAKPVGNYSDDFPRVDVQGVEYTSKLKSFGASYGYSVQDMRRAAMANLPLEQERALAARLALATKLDEVIANGFANLGLTGFVNNATLIAALVAPATGSWELPATSAEEIVGDLVKMEAEIITTSKGVELPDTLALSPTRYAYASTKVLTGTDTTALDFFLRRSQGVKNVEQWARLETADVAGTGPRNIMYKRDPAKVCALVPVEFEAFPPQAKGMAFEISCHMRCGGTIFRYPLSARYMDGC